MALAMVGATAISASASTHSSSSAGAGAATEDKAQGADQTQKQASTQKQDTAKAAQLAAQRQQVAKHRAAVQKAAAHKAAVNKLRAIRAAKHRAQVTSQHRFVLPMQQYTFTSTFGQRWGRLHAGIDLAAPVGTPVHAMSTGTVMSAGPMQGYGNALLIRYWDGTTSLYGHLSNFVVHKGEKVAPGQLVAHSGNTGHSTGPHLHFEIRPKDSAANELAHASRSVTRLARSVQGNSSSLLTRLASQDAMARAGVEPAPINPLPWLKAHGILPRGAHA